MNAQAAFRKANHAISKCNWDDAASILLSLLTTVFVLGPYSSPEEVDDAIDAVAKQMKSRVREKWPQRHQAVTRH